jgi:hypothetical protein
MFRSAELCVGMRIARACAGAFAGFCDAGETQIGGGV